MPRAKRSRPDRPSERATAAAARRAVREIADPETAAASAWFFKTGPGEYGEGDRFLGVRVPDIRTLARRFEALSIDQMSRLLRSRFHEDRMLALLIAVRQYQKGDEATRRAIHDFYMAHLEHIDNWDLVDVTAPHVIGAYYRDRDRKPLYRLARSAVLWHRRIAIIATAAFIREDDFTDTLALAERLLDDREDLMHKAVGWMLREVGKRDVGALRTFLGEHHGRMPRTMLRYAIEKLPEPERQRWLGRKKGAVSGASRGDRPGAARARRS